MRDQDRFRGCLLAGAAGDALGYEVEFLSEGEIFRRFGERGITEYRLHNGVAVISDDTQMTLFTATGLLWGTTGGRTRGIMGPYAESIRLSYLDWLRTQEESYPLRKKDPGAWEEPASWLTNLPELFHRRAPGNTCLSALRDGGTGTPEVPVNGSKGCGGVMRVAPVGLYFSGRQKTPAQVARIGAEAAAVTHGHPLGWMPAALLSQIIHEVSGRDETIRDAALHALDTLEELWPEAKGREYLTALVKKAIDLAEESQTDLDAIHRLGEGWAGDEALAVAVYCALKYENDFDRCLVAAVNHKGDSDSTGAIAGDILGAKLGLSQIPEKYTANLELKDVILEIADDLWRDCPMGGDDPGNCDPAWIRKYIEMTYRK
jgi:ADP-ribosylglycohydrolase